MDLKDAIKKRLCMVGDSYPGLDAFVQWAEVLERPVLFRILDDLQVEFDEEVSRTRSVVERVGGGQLHLQLYEQWSQRCAEVRAYYRRNDRRRPAGYSERSRKDS